MPKYACCLLIAVLTLAFPCRAPAESQGTLLVKSQYFSVMAPPDIDIFNVLNKMHYDYFLQADSLLQKKTDDPKMILGRTLDAVLLESARIMGIHIYSFQATLEFLPDQNALKIIIKNVAGVDVDERAFYLEEQKTIYISLEELTIGVIGHEMAHALICHYFGAPPAANIQEILAGYVDYTLSKDIKK